MKTVSSYEHTGSKEHPAGRFSSRIGASPGHTTREQCVVQEGVSKAQKRPQYKSKLATLVKYT